MQRHFGTITIFFIWVAIICGCSGTSSSGTGGVSLDFTGEAIGALPQIASIRTDHNERTNISSIGIVANFFKYECHMPGSSWVNYCDSTIDVTVDNGYNDYKLSSTTLIGLVYHAQMYAQNYHTESASHQTCGSGDATEKTLTASSWIGSSGATDPDRFLIDVYELLECAGTISYEGNSTVIAYNKALDNSYYTSISARKNVPFSGNANILQTDVMQPYVGLTAGTPTFLAFNHAGISSLYARAILLTNLTNHTFAVKYQTGPNTYVIAIGVGGVDRATGSPNPGHYLVKYNDGSTENTLCVNNATGEIEASTATCTTSNSIPWDWADSTSVSNYLSMTADEITRLTNYLSFFDDNQALAVGQYPTSTPSDVDNFFPTNVQ